MPQSETVELKLKLIKQSNGRAQTGRFGLIIITAAIKLVPNDSVVRFVRPTKKGIGSLLSLFSFASLLALLASTVPPTVSPHDHIPSTLQGYPSKEKDHVKKGDCADNKRVKERESTLEWSLSVAGGRR